MKPLSLLLTLVMAACVTSARFERPAAITWGASAAQLQQTLAGQCSTQRLRPIDPPFLPDVRDRQMQIDCEGFQFFGRGRHVEFVIRDDQLVMVWLMVEPQETDQVVAALTSAYGTPTGRNQNYVAFERARTAWRFHPAEILFYAPELDADMAPDFR